MISSVLLAIFGLSVLIFGIFLINSVKADGGGILMICVGLVAIGLGILNFNANAKQQVRQENFERWLAPQTGRFADREEALEAWRKFERHREWLEFEREVSEKYPFSQSLNVKCVDGSLYARTTGNILVPLLEDGKPLSCPPTSEAAVQ